MTRAQKIQIFLSYLLSFIILIGAVVALYNGYIYSAFLAGLSFVFTYIPAFIEKNFKIFLPIEFELIIIIFVFASLFLGEVNEYYTYYWWWDILVHTVTGFLLGFVGFIIVYILYSEDKIKIRMSPFFVGLFTFVFSMAIGAMWEIFEFFLDLSVGSEWQPSLWDTMWDLTVNCIGAVCISFMGYYYLKKFRVPILGRLIEEFVNKNPALFSPWLK